MRNKFIPWNLSPIRDADWFGTERAIGYARIFALAYIPGLIFIFLVATDVILIRHGERGTDFLSFWTGAQATVHSGAASAYDYQAAREAQGFSKGFYPFMLPPPILALIIPLVILPYWLALLTWAVTTYAVYLSIARRLLSGALWPIAVYPAAFINAAHGQIAAVTAMLFCGAALTWRTRPFVAGMLLGGFVIKPHLAILFPVAMLAGRQWRVIAGAATSSSLLIAGSALLFGPEAWFAFIQNARFGQWILETRPEVWPIMTSLFAAVRMASGPVWLAYLCQAGLFLALAFVVARTWRNNAIGGRAKFSILAIAGILATPYVYHYDLLVLILPLCWAAEYGLRAGFPPWSKLVLAANYMLPFGGMAMAYGLGVNLAWLVIFAFLMLALLIVKQSDRVSMER